MQRLIYRHQPKTTLKAATIAGFGSFIAIVVLAVIGNVSGYLWLIAPFGASCGLMFGFHSSPFSQPANVIGGHLLSAFIGLGLHFLMPGQLVAEGLSVGIAVAAMMALRIVHPPAGATALVTYLTASNWLFLVFPIFSGSVLLVAMATTYHWLAKNSYPHPLPTKK